MSSTGQTVPQLPMSRWHRNPQFWVAIVALVIQVIGLVIRPEFPSKWAALIAGFHAALGRIVAGIRVTPHADPSYDPILAKLIYGVHWGTILAFVIIHHSWLKRMARKVNSSMPIARETLRQFSLGWLCLWYGWLVLYGWFYLTAGRTWYNLPAVGAVSDILDTISGFALWWCFLVLDLPSVNIEGQPNRDKTFRRAVWVAALAGLACASLGAGDKLFDINHLGVVVGLYNALAMACLTGRFGSHFIAMPRRLLLCLYFYSMVQVFYSFLPLLQAGMWVPLVYLTALVLKIALAYAGYDMIRNGGLERYLLAAQNGKLDMA